MVSGIGVEYTVYGDLGCSLGFDFALKASGVSPIAAEPESEPPMKRVGPRRDFPLRELDRSRDLFPGGAFFFSTAPSPKIPGAIRSEP